MNPRYLLGVLIFAVSVVGLSMGAAPGRWWPASASGRRSSLAIGALSAIPAAGMILGALLVGRLCRHFSGRQLYPRLLRPVPAGQRRPAAARAGACRCWPARACCSASAWACW